MLGWILTRNQSPIYIYPNVIKTYYIVSLNHVNHRCLLAANLDHFFLMIFNLFTLLNKSRFYHLRLEVIKKQYNLFKPFVLSEIVVCTYLRNATNPKKLSFCQILYNITDVGLTEFESYRVITYNNVIIKHVNSSYVYLHIVVT